MLNTSAINGKKPYNNKAVFYQNSLRNDGHGLSTADFDSSWAQFIRDNGLECDTQQLKSKWRLPQSLSQLKNSSRIINFRTSTIIGLDDNTLLGLVRYEKKSPFSAGNVRQGATRRQATVLFLPKATNLNFLISFPKNFAAQYVSGNLTRASQESTDIYYSQGSHEYALQLAKQLTEKKLYIDIEVGSGGVWLLLGGDKRDPETLTLIYDFAKNISLPETNGSLVINETKFVKVHKITPFIVRLSESISIFLLMILAAAITLIYIRTK